MKASFSFLWLLALTCGFQQAICQLDTLYFDDFDDDRPRTYATPVGSGNRDIRDGFLEISDLQSRNNYSLSTFQALADASDTIVYEIKMHMDSVFMVGPTFFLNYTTPRKNGKKLLCCYQAVVVNPKDLHSYTYRRADGGPEFAWAPKGMNLDRQEVTFRLSYVPTGFVHFDWNGQRIHSQRQRSLAKNHDFRYWGWVSRGNAKYRIDYVCVLGRAKTVSGE